MIFLLIRRKYLTMFPSGDMPLFIHSQTWSFVARHPTAKSTQRCLWSFSPLSLLYQPWIRGDDIFNLVALSKASKAFESYHSCAILQTFIQGSISHYMGILEEISCYPSCTLNSTVLVSSICHLSLIVYFFSKVEQYIGHGCSSCIKPRYLQLIGS